MTFPGLERGFGVIERRVAADGLPSPGADSTQREKNVLINAGPAESSPPEFEAGPVREMGKRCGGMQMMTSLKGLRTQLDCRGFSYQELGNGTAVVLDPESMRVLTLNDTGFILFRAMVEEAPSVEELVTCLTDTFDVPPAVAFRDVEAFLMSLERQLG